MGRVNHRERPAVRQVRLTYPTAVVLVAVSRGLRYGFDIIDATGLQSGSVYPILRRLEDAGLLRSKWEPVRTARDEQRPPRRYYQVTGAGAEVLREALQRFPGLAHAPLGPRGQPLARAPARLHRRGGAHVGDRHRREHGDLQRRERGAVSLSPIRRARPPR